MYTFWEKFFEFLCKILQKKLDKAYFLWYSALHWVQTRRFCVKIRYFWDILHEIAPKQVKNERICTKIQQKHGWFAGNAVRKPADQTKIPLRPDGIGLQGDGGTRTPNWRRRV